MKSKKNSKIKLAALFLCILMLLPVIFACNENKNKTVGQETDTSDAPTDPSTNELITETEEETTEYEEITGEQNNNDFLYEITSDDTITIMGYIGNETEVTIPDYIDGYKVASIYTGEYAFDGWNNLTAINVAEDHTVYSSLDGVLFNKDKTEIIYYPDKKSDASYTIPDSVKKIGGHAFVACNFASATIPDSVTEIGFFSFGYCEKLTSITIPDSVTYIGVVAFKDCIGLTSVTIPGSVNIIDVSAFINCTSLTDVIIEDGVAAINSGAFSYCENLTSVTIPDSVTHIGNDGEDGLPHTASAFGFCPNLTITCPDGSYAHQYCIDNNIAFILK